MNYFFVFLSDIIYIAIVSFYLALLFAHFDKKKIPIMFVISFVSVYFHELLHKAVATSLGYVAVIQTQLSPYFIALSAIIYYFTGYVVPPPIFTAIIGKYEGLGIKVISLSPWAKPYDTFLISIAGPIANIIIYIIAKILLYTKYYSDQYEKEMLTTLAHLNKMLILVNLLPIIPSNDGFLAMTALQAMLAKQHLLIMG